MIPRVCANCFYGQTICNDKGQAVLTLCQFLPLILGQNPNHACGQFKFSDNPLVQEDSNATQQGNTDDEVLNGLGAGEQEIKKPNTGA